MDENIDECNISDHHQYLDESSLQNIIRETKDELRAKSQADFEAQSRLKIAQLNEELSLLNIIVEAKEKLRLNSLRDSEDLNRLKSTQSKEKSILLKKLSDANTALYKL